MKNKIPQVHNLMQCTEEGYGRTSKYDPVSCLLMLSSLTNKHKRHTQYFKYSQCSNWNILTTSIISKNIS